MRAWLALVVEALACAAPAGVTGAGAGSTGVRWRALACAAGADAGESSWRFRAWLALAMVLGALACATG